MFQPSWRHLPEKNNQTMITYKESDINFSWNLHQISSNESKPHICGYVKEDEELEGNEVDVTKWTVNQNRQKRQIDQYEYNKRKTRCPLLLVADYRFYKEMGASNTKTTINYLVSNYLICIITRSCSFFLNII